MTGATSTVAAEGAAAVAPAVLVGVPEDPAVLVAFTGRAAGNLSLVVGDVDDTIARREAALDALGARLDDLVVAEQVHGAGVATVDRRAAGRGARSAEDVVSGVDALVTSEDGVALAALAADCVPLVLVAPGRAVAAVHAGRRGVTAGVVRAAVAELAAASGLDRDASQVVAFIGPAIGGCCYEVEAAVAHDVAAVVPASAAATTWGTPSLDLPAAVSAQLDELGVGRVERVGGCTRCGSQRWFSHRAATAGTAPAGRHAALVVRRQTAALHLHGTAGPRP